MLARLLLLLMLLQAAELALLVWIGMETVWYVPIGLVLATGLAGTLLMRFQGWRTFTRVRSDLAASRLPADSLFDGFLVLVAGLLLIMPGLLSDFLAILLLLPAVRRLVKAYLKLRVGGRLLGRFSQAGRPAAHDEIIDVRVTESPPRSVH